MNWHAHQAVILRIRQSGQGYLKRDPSEPGDKVLHCRHQGAAPHQDHPIDPSWLRQEPLCCCCCCCC